MRAHIETHMQHIIAGIKWQNMFGIDQNKPPHTYTQTHTKPHSHTEEAGIFGLRMQAEI